MVFNNKNVLLLWHVQQEVTEVTGPHHLNLALRLVEELRSLMPHVRDIVRGKGSKTNHLLALKVCIEKRLTRYFYPHLIDKIYGVS